VWFEGDFWVFWCFVLQNSGQFKDFLTLKFFVLRNLWTILKGFIFECFRFIILIVFLNILDQQSMEVILNILDLQLWYFCCQKFCIIVGIFLPNINRMIAGISLQHLRRV
jgi:hypothetical protein